MIGIMAIVLELILPTCFGILVWGHCRARIGVCSEEGYPPADGISHYAGKIFWGTGGGKGNIFLGPRGPQNGMLAGAAERPLVTLSV